MQALSPFLRAGLLLLGVSACGGAAASNLAKSVVDSLPGGIPRVTSSGPTAWTDSAGAALVEVNRFSGDDGTDAELGDPRSIAVDAQDRIYVVDDKPAAIKVFSADGKLVRIIGREGEGPGEFRIGFIAVRNDHIVLHDPRVSRTSVWDTAGTFIRSFHTSCCYWSDIQLDTAGRIYVPSMSAPSAPTKSASSFEANSRGTAWVRYTVEGALVDTFWVPKGPEEKYWTVKADRGSKNVSMMSTSIPFRPSLTYGLDPAGGMVMGFTGDYSFVRTRTGSDTVRVMRRAWTPDPITSERRNGELESRIKESKEQFGEANLRAAFKLEDIPATLPAYLNLRVDQSGRVWARRYAVADTGKSYFDVFDANGAFLGPVTVPLKMSEYGLQAWTGNGVVTVIEDEEGRPTVVRLRLEIRGRR